MVQNRQLEEICLAPPHRLGQTRLCITPNGTPHLPYTPENKVTWPCGMELSFLCFSPPPLPPPLYKKEEKQH